MGGCAGLVRESQTHWTWGESPGGARPGVYVPSTLLTGTPGPLVCRLHGHSCGDALMFPPPRSQQEAEGSSWGSFLPSPKRDDLRRYKIKAPKP